MHQLIHDERRTGHIAGVLHKGNEQIEDYNVGQKDDDAAHAAHNAIHDQCFQGAFRHVAPDQVSQAGHKPFDPLHGVVSQAKGCLKHDPEEEEKKWKSQIFIRDNGIQQFCFVGKMNFSGECLFQPPGNESVTGICECRLRIFAQQLLDIGAFLVSPCKDLFPFRERLYATFHLLVSFQHLHADIAQRHVPVCYITLHKFPFHDGD